MNKKEIILTLLIFVLVIGVGAYIKTQAGSTDSAAGWLWGGSEEDPNDLCWVDDNKNGNRDPGEIKCRNLVIDGNETGVGWVSMNSTNCDKDDNGFIDVRYCDLDNNTFIDALCGYDNATDISASCGGDNTTTTVVNYGVNIPPSGAVTGFAWSSNLGWIDFGPATNCVGDINNILDDISPKYEADSCTPPAECGAGEVSRSGDDLIGCARIVSIAQASVTDNSGGWTGWINMKGTATDGTEYGAVISGTDMSGYVWSGGETTPELGYIDFSQATINAADNLKICIDACDSGLLIADGSTRDMNPGDILNVKACYNTSASCDSTLGDVTANPATSWTTDETPPSYGNAVQLSGTNTRQITANSITGTVTERVSANYSGNSSSFNARVTQIPALCGNGTTESTEECDTGGTMGPCPASCNNCKRNDCGGYIEVKP